MVGPKNTYRLFFSVVGQNISLSDAPAFQTGASVLHHLNGEGFADYIAQIIVTAPYELSGHMDTFDRRWKAVPAAKKIVLDQAGMIIRLASFDAVFDHVLESLPTLDCAMDDLRDAVDQHLHSAPSG